jgi:hypothetical protein
MWLDDVYAKLHAPAPTPVGELCRCTDAPYKLMSALGFNPVHCRYCNLEVPPDSLGFSPSLVEAIAGWRNVYDAIDRLWLDSGPYEQWARRELADIASAVNQHGRQIQKQISTVRRCFYWYFQDHTDPAFRPVDLCPVCGESLRDYPSGTFLQRVCENDSIVTPGP